jgi:hypothetical protein
MEVLGIGCDAKLYRTNLQGICLVDVYLVLGVRNIAQMDLSRLTRFCKALLFGRNRSLRSYEATIMDSIIKASSFPDQSTLRAQLDSREWIQRWADRIVRIGVRPMADIKPIDCTNESHCYASIKLKAPMGAVIAKLMTHRGYLSTLEFSKSPKSLLSAGFDIQGVTLHTGGSGYTAEIDASEHGNETDA